MSKRVSTTGRKSGRVRPFTVIFYGSEIELKKILRDNRERIAHFAYILHDKCVYLDDLKDDNGDYVHRAGEPEKVHFHVLIDFYNAHTFNAVKRMFTTEVDNPRVEPVSDRVAQYEYLIHKNDPDKYQYPKSAIVSDDINYYEKLCVNGDRRESDNVAEQIVNDMLARVAPRIMVARYGRDYIIHYRQYMEIVDQIRYWDIEHPKKEYDKPTLKEDDTQMEIPF